MKTKKDAVINVEDKGDAGNNLDAGIIDVENPSETLGSCEFRTIYMKINLHMNIYF